MTESPNWTLTLKDWRGLEHVSWSPDGVVLLAGPNGSGKTSILEAISFLRSAWLRGVNAALRWGRGASYLRRIGADPSTPVTLALEVGDLRWELLLGADGVGVHTYHGETLQHGEELLLQRDLFSPEWSLGTERRGADERTGLRVLWDRSAPQEIEPLVKFLGSIRSYDVYHLGQIRRGADVKHESDSYLHPTGRNLLWVLRNWKMASRRFNGQFAWVLEQLKRAFPDQLEDIEFDAIGQAIQCRFYPVNTPSPEDSLPIQGNRILVNL